MKKINRNGTRLSVIIVNYNVRDFLLHSIQSIIKSLNNIKHEIIVVDNASVDGSVQSVRKKFDDITIIENDTNMGFSAANNKGIIQSAGQYVVLINPDTIVQEDTFLKLIKFMDEHLDAGAVTCKILNPDGSFSIDSRHSVPTPTTALWKLLGLNRLFPKSKIFGRYNLTYLDPEKTYPVDAISGSFMFLRKKAIDQVGLLDEDYFMYCEDVDYCYRLNRNGWKIYYFPDTNIIHYKGESTKKSNIDYVINFNKSLYLFYKKHFHKNSVALFRWFILTGVTFRGILIYLKNSLKKFFPNILDILILNFTLFVTFYIRFEIKSQFSFNDFLKQYIYIHFITTIIFVGVSYFYDIYSRYKLSFSRVLKTNLWTFIIVSASTFFLREFAFSRLIIILSAIISPILMIFWRALGMKKFYGSEHSIFAKRTLLVGTDEESRKILKKLKSSIESNYKLCGLATITEKDIGTEIEGIAVVTHLDNLHEYTRLERISHIIFSTHNISYEKILKTMAEMADLNIDFKIVPEKMDVMIGKSSVEKLSDFPFIDIDYAVGRSFNKFTKRLFDILISLPVAIITSPIWFLYLFKSRKKLKKYPQSSTKERKFFILQNEKNPFRGFGNTLFLILYVLSGKISLVGSPLRTDENLGNQKLYKPGITGLIQINDNIALTVDDIKRYNLYYLKNQTVWLDLKILYRAVFNK